jgi:hypothetical protein
VIFYLLYCINQDRDYFFRKVEIHINIFWRIALSVKLIAHSFDLICIIYWIDLYNFNQKRKPTPTYFLFDYMRLRVIFVLWVANNFCSMYSITFPFVQLSKSSRRTWLCLHQWMSNKLFFLVRIRKNTSDKKINKKKTNKV